MKTLKKLMLISLSLAVFAACETEEEEQIFQLGEEQTEIIQMVDETPGFDNQKSFGESKKKQESEDVIVLPDDLKKDWN